MSACAIEMGVEESERQQAARLRELTTKEESLRKAPIVTIAQFLAVDIVAGQPASDKYVRAFLLQAVFNLIRHGLFLFISRRLSILWGNYFFIWTEPDYVINTGIILGQSMTIGCAFPFYYYTTRHPDVIQPTLRILTTIHGMTPSSLPVKTVTRLRRLISMTDAFLKYIVLTLALMGVDLMYIGYTLVSEDDIYLTVIIWPLVQFVAGVGTFVIAYGTVRMFMAQNLVLAARLKQVIRNLKAANKKLKEHDPSTFASRAVEIIAHKQTIASLGELNKIRRDVVACNEFWKKASLGITFGVPAITFTLYFIAEKNMDIVALGIAVVMIICLTVLVSIFFFSGSQINNLVMRHIFEIVNYE